MREGPRTRVWGKVALERMRAGPAGPKPQRNRFADVAVRWAAGLLRECDVVKHGVDLFGRDCLVLGRLVSSLAAFMECTAGTPTSVPLASATLELLRSPAVHGHMEPYVRRAALLAAGQVMAALPPARVAAAMVGRRQDAVDGALVERLQWVQDWSQQVAASDSDDTCRAMAGACINLQADLASQAMAAIKQGDGNDGLLPAGPLGGFPVGGVSLASLQQQLPTVVLPFQTSIS